VGVDYIRSLGVTHVQLMPIYDFATINEFDPKSTYNWGYDPVQYFVPEGSYASELSDPYSRIVDLKALVRSFHQAGIRVNMDVVFNHVYQYEYSNFEKVVPNYYFRRTRDGRISNGSGCSNDVATERPMIRKMIVDACVYWLEEYGIDGYRFDLMGLMDIETMKQIEEEVRAIKPNFMLYGEGWNMMTVLPHEQKAMMDNAFSLPNYGFFNDSFREIVKGGSFEDKLREPGYILGAGHYRLGFKFAYVGSCINLIFPAKFLTAKQSINYVECHDNGTLFDKIAISNGHEDERTRLKRVMLANAAVMLSFGIPFFHRGQEIGLTKYGDSNSYRSGDKINKFDYSILDERAEMATFFKALTDLRKDCPFLRLEQRKDIEKMIEFEDLDHDAISIEYVDTEHLAPYQKFKVIINPSTETLFYALEDYQKIIFNTAGYAQAKMDTYVKNVMVAPVSLLIVGLRKDDGGR
jgi:pullulanase